MKSNPLAAALSVRQADPPMTETPAVRPKASTRPNKRQISVYLPIPVHEYLRTLAFESRRSIHSILMEGLNQVLAEHGTSIASLTKDAGETPRPAQ